MTPDYEYNGKCHIRFFNCDNMEFMKEVENKYDLAIVDPPYGLGDRLSNGGGQRKNDPSRLLYVEKDWDCLPSKEYWSQLFKISKNQIVFGANYFLQYLKNTRGFVCWDKNQAMPTLSACELVWTSFDKPAKIMKKSSTDLMRFHPTQKPIYVYRFMLNYVGAKQGDKIIDTHGGSMTLARACYEEGFDLDIIELDKEYFDKGVLAFKQHVSQYNLFQ